MPYTNLYADGINGWKELRTAVALNSVNRIPRQYALSPLTFLFIL